MPQKILDVANSALIKIGAPVITSLAEQTKHAELANERVRKVRDLILRQHPWSFATEFAHLTSDEQSVNGWAHRFNLPARCVRILSITSGRVDIEQYDLAGRSLYAQMSEIDLRYTAVPDDEAEDAKDHTYPDDFAEAWAFYLAADLSVALYESQAGVQEFMRSYQKALSDARFNNAIERPARVITASSWLESRLYFNAADPDHRPLDIPPEGI